MLIQAISIHGYPHFGFSIFGEVQRPEFSWKLDEGGWPVYSRALVCTHCRRVWAELRIIGQISFCIEGVTCESCADQPESTDFPGSLLDNYTCNGTDWGLIEALPEPLLRREFELHLRTFP